MWTCRSFLPSCYTEISKTIHENKDLILCLGSLKEKSNCAFTFYIIYLVVSLQGNKWWSYDYVQKWSIEQTKKKYFTAEHTSGERKWD